MYYASLSKRNYGVIIYGLKDYNEGVKDLKVNWSLSILLLSVKLKIVIIKKIQG